MENTFGELVRAERERLGWSQSDLARELGTSRQHVFLLERGGSVPRLDTVKKLAKALGLFVTIGDKKSRRRVSM